MCRGESQSVINSFSLNEKRGCIRTGFIHLELQVGIEDGCPLRNIQVVEAHANDLIIFVKDKLKVTAAPVHHP